MFNMKRNQKGFTLIELMIVIAIVAILVALAVPAYRDYTIRTKVGECINGAAVAKLQISEYAETVGAWPPDEDAAGTASPAGQSQFCSAFIYSANGIFEIDTNEPNIDSLVAAATIQPRMVPTINGQGGVDWQCQQGSTDATAVKYLPSTCRSANTP
ncbi:MAG: pilin [Xanthomonadales bacterium]|nr:pilin [Xanthomonadales bacterium]